MTQLLSTKLVHAWGGIDQAHPGLDTLDEIVSLKCPVPFSHHGRTAWLPLDRPITATNHRGESFEINALKIKGVGLHDQKGNFSPPSNAPYIRSSRHNGVMKDGSLKIVSSAPAPLGGITLRRARAEYEASRVLFENGVSCQIPIRLYEYCEPSLNFQVSEGVIQPLGVVITGHFSRTYLRGGIIERIDDVEEVLRAGYRAPPSLKFASDAKTATCLLKDTYSQYGKILRRFSELGLYRHNGHVINLGLVPETGRIYLTDLDSSLFLEECADIERSWQVLRDAVSGLYQILFTVVEPRNRRLFPAELVHSEKIIDAYLEAYYHDVPARRIEQLSAPLHDYCRHLYHVIEEEKPSETDDYRSFVEGLWRTTMTMPFQEAHAWLFGACRVLHQESSISASYPLGISVAQFYVNLADYAGSDVAQNIKATLSPLMLKPPR